MTGAGKLFHGGVPPNFDQPKSWSAAGPDGAAWPYEEGKNSVVNTCKSKCCAAEARPNATHAKMDGHYCLYKVKNGTKLQDQNVRDIVTGRLRAAVSNWKEHGQPFFVGMGTHKPHLG